MKWSQAQKAILQEVFAEVFFLGETITAFRVAPSFIAELGQAKNASTETIHLDQPFRILEPAPRARKRAHFPISTEIAVSVLGALTGLSSQEAQENLTEVTDRKGVAQLGSLVDEILTSVHDSHFATCLYGAQRLSRKEDSPCGYSPTLTITRRSS